MNKYFEAGFCFHGAAWQQRVSATKDNLVLDPGSSGIWRQYLFGLDEVVAQNIVGVGGIASGEAIGQPTISTGVTPADIIGVGGIASAEALGTPAVGASVSAAGIATVNAVGSPSLAVSLILAGIGSGEAVGAPSVGVQLVLQGVVSEEAIGMPTISTGGDEPSSQRRRHKARMRAFAGEYEWR